jgi:FkbM family methyltransferase
LKKLVKNFLNTKGYTLKKKQITDDVHDVLKMLIKKESLIIDIGAHNGESALKFREVFPYSLIYSFEPFFDSFEILVENLKDTDDVEAINKGICDVDEKKYFNINAGSPTNSLLKLDDTAKDTWNHNGLTHLKTIECDFCKLDTFLEERAITSIDLLKIDAQGSEYLVLKGAKKALIEKKINVIYMEIILGDTYVGQKSFEYYLATLKEYGYYLQGMYNFAYSDDNILIQLDAVFIHNKSK